MEFQRFFNDPQERKEPQDQNLITLLHLRHRKQNQFQEAEDSLARLEEDLDEYQSRIEDAITSHMKLHDIGILVLHDPHLPVEEVWLCKMSAIHGNVTMTRVAQVQACAIKEVPF